MAQNLKPVSQTKTVIPDHAWSHRMAPADLVDRHPKRGCESLPFVGAGSPPTNDDRLDPFAVQLGSLGNFFDRQTGFLKQQIHRANRQDDLPVNRPDS